MFRTFNRWIYWKSNAKFIFSRGKRQYCLGIGSNHSNDIVRLISSKICNYYTSFNNRSFCRTCSILGLLVIYGFIYIICLCTFMPHDLASRWIILRMGSIGFCRRNCSSHERGMGGSCWSNVLRKKKSTKSESSSYYLCIIRNRFIMVRLVWF